MLFQWLVHAFHESVVLFVSVMYGWRQLINQVLCNYSRSKERAEYNDTLVWIIRCWVSMVRRRCLLKLRPGGERAVVRSVRVRPPLQLPRGLVRA